MQRCSIEKRTCWFDDSDKATSHSHAVTHWLGRDRGICFTVLEDGTEWINCRRGDYAFWVGRPNSETPWQLNLLKKSTSLQASDYTSRVLRRSFYPDFLFRHDMLLDAIDKPCFQLLTVEREPTTKHPNRYKVAFDYAHPFRPTVGDHHYNFVQNGTMWLDADNCWLIVRLQVELRTKGDPSWTQQEFEFDSESYRGVRLPVRCTTRDLDSNWRRQKAAEYSVDEFRRLDPVDLDPSSMHLSHYGFAEPDLLSTECRLEFSLKANCEFPVGKQSAAPFTVRNCSRDLIRIVRATAC